MNKNFSAFFGDDPDVLEGLKNASGFRRYAAGSLIAGEDDEDNAVFYILEGSAHALRYGEAGTEVFIDTFHVGQLMGEMAVLGNGRRSADIYALTDIAVAVIPGPAFLNLMEKHGVIGLLVSRLLAKRIRNTTRRMFEQSTLSSKGRVYAELMRMAGPGEEDGAQKIKDVPAISDIAKRLGITRETVSRTVSRLKEEAIVERQGPDLIIRHPDVLVSRLS